MANFKQMLKVSAEKRQINITSAHHNLLRGIHAPPRQPSRQGPKFDFVNIGGQAGYLNLNIWQG